MTNLLLIGLLLAIPSTEYGYVTEKTVEGGSQFNDYYIINLSGDLYEIEADDLEAGDPVTVYRLNNNWNISWTKYGIR